MNPLHRFLELTEDWKWLFRRDGWRTALPEIGTDLIHLPYRRLRFYLLHRSLSTPWPSITAGLNVEIRRFERVDLAEVARIYRPSEARLCARRHQAGQFGLAALFDGRVVGYAWACGESHREIERVPLILHPGEALCTDAFTDPAWRGRGVQSALTLARFQLLESLGFKDALSYILVQNKSSLAVWQKKLGSEIIGEFEFIRFGPFVSVKFGGGFCEEADAIRFGG